MRVLVIEQTLSVVNVDPLDVAALQRLVGGYFRVVYVYDGAAPGETVGVHVAEGATGALTVFLPEALEVLRGPVALAGFATDGTMRGLSDADLSCFSLVAVNGTPVPRLAYTSPTILL